MKADILSTKKMTRTTRCKCDSCVRGVSNWRGFFACKYSLLPSTCGKYQANENTLILERANEAFK